MNLTISKKLLALSGSGLLFVVAIGLAGFLGSRNIGEGMEEVTRTAKALQLHMEADMMHDAIRSDVLAALLAEDETARAEVKKTLQEHSETFQQAIKDCSSLKLSDTLQKTLANVGDALTAYIEQAGKHVDLAFADKNAAKDKLGEFTDVFEVLETRMADLSAQIEEEMVKARTVQSGAVDEFRMNLLYLLIGAMVVAGAISWYIVRGVTHSLDELVKVLADISEGEGDLTARIAIRSKDEIGQLAKSFNLFLEKIHAIVKEITENAKQLSNASQTIATTSGEIAKTTDDMIAQSNSSAAATEQASTNIRNVAAAIEQISASSRVVATDSSHVNENLTTVGEAVQEFSGRMTSVASAVGEMSASLGAMATSVAELSSSLGGVSSKTSQANVIAENASTKAAATAETIHRLGASAKEIDKVVDLITGIAEQTNLLALNASIEAASAGDAGKGFAVVANEVKELAKQTARATQDIRAQVEGMQSNTAASVSAISEIVEIIKKVCEVFADINQAVRQQTEGLQEISRGVNDAALGSTEVSSNVQRAAVNASEVSQNILDSISSVTSITRNISELAQGANEIARNAAEASTGMNEVAGLVQSVNHTTDANRSRVSGLDHAAKDLGSLASRLETLVASFSV